MNKKLELAFIKIERQCKEHYEHVCEVKQEKNKIWMDLACRYDSEQYGMAKMILFLYGSDSFDKALIPIREYRNKIDDLYLN